MSETNEMFFSAYTGEQTDDAVGRAVTGGEIDKKIDGMAVSFAVVESSAEEVTTTIAPFQSLTGGVPLKVLNLTLNTNAIQNSAYLIEWHTIFTATAELKAVFAADSAEYCIRFNKTPVYRNGAVYEISFTYLHGQTVTDEGDADYGKKIIAAILKEW